MTIINTPFITFYYQHESYPKVVHEILTAIHQKFNMKGTF